MIGISWLMYCIKSTVYELVSIPYIKLWIAQIIVFAKHSKSTSLHPAEDATRVCEVSDRSERCGVCGGLDAAGTTGRTESNKTPHKKQKARRGGVPPLSSTD
jgi:hypothetical protein